jgi:hypothetical protein
MEGATAVPRRQVAADQVAMGQRPSIVREDFRFVEDFGSPNRFLANPPIPGEVVDRDEVPSSLARRNLAAYWWRSWGEPAPGYAQRSPPLLLPL